MDERKPIMVRKKPVIVEAMRFLAYTEGLGPAEWNKDQGGCLWRWLRANKVDFWLGQEEDGPVYLKINTLEGVMRADILDWIIKGVKGEFYPCKPDIFEATYDIVPQPNQQQKRKK
jgi:hypothetical protein